MRNSAAAVTAHLEWMRQRGLSPTYILKRRRILTGLAGALPRPILAASSRDLARWRGTLNQAPATVLHHVSHVREFYAWAVSARLIPLSPAAELPMPRVRRGIPRPIAEADLMTAVNAASGRIRPWLVLAGWAGLRAQEIARLRREDILDRSSPPVIVVSAFAAKGGRMRIVPLSAFVLAELGRAGLPARGWVFRRLDGQPGPNAPWVVSQLSGAHLHECGIPASLHQLRHRFGTVTYQKTRDLRLVQELMGHADPATTAIYADYDRAGALDAVNAIPAPPAA
ncbi:MAG TPA: tyrosine-type recombinase/integrase [Streptosporangiaceae bacterium]